MEHDPHNGHIKSVEQILNPDFWVQSPSSLSSQDASQYTMKVDPNLDYTDSRSSYPPYPPTTVTNGSLSLGDPLDHNIAPEIYPPLATLHAPCYTMPFNVRMNGGSVHLSFTEGQNLVRATDTSTGTYLTGEGTFVRSILGWKASDDSTQSGFYNYCEHNQEPAIRHSQQSMGGFSSIPESASQDSRDIEATYLSSPTRMPSTDQHYGYRSSSLLSHNRKDILCVSTIDIPNNLPDSHYRVPSPSRSHPGNRNGPRLRQHSTQDEFLRSKYPQGRRHVLGLAIRFRDEHDPTQIIPHDLIDGLLEVAIPGKYHCFCCPGKKRARTITPARDHVRKSLGNFPFRCPNPRCQHSSLRQADLNKHTRNCRYSSPSSLPPPFPNPMSETPVPHF